MNPILESYVEDFCDNFGFSDKDDSDIFERFINYCTVDRFCPTKFGVEEVTTKGGEIGIDGAAVIIGDYIVQSEEEAKEELKNRTSNTNVNYIFSQSKTGNSFKVKEIRNFYMSVKDLISENKKFEQDRWLEEIRSIHNVVVDNATKIEGGMPSCHLFYAATGDWKNRKSDDLEAVVEEAQKEIDSLNIFDPINFNPIGIDQINDLWMSTISPIEASIVCEDELSIPTMEGVNQAYIVITRADHFVDEVLEDESEDKITPGIFDQNVRHFLGTDNEVNEKIEYTLDNEMKKNRFSILNNGITIVSSKVERITEKIIMEDFQIVNGCQTSHILFKNRDKLDERVTVPIKVIETEDTDIVDEVVKATNSQTAIDDSQMFAVKEYVKNVQQFFNAYGSQRDDSHRVYFERRSREYADEDIAKLRTFDIHQLAKVFAAMFLDQPHLSTAYAGRIYDKHEDDLFNSNQAEIGYYTSALVYYKLMLIFNGGHLPSKFRKYKWQLPMVIKYKFGGKSTPEITNKEWMGKYCGKIIDKFSDDTSELSKNVKEAIKVFNPMGNVPRSDLKTLGFTNRIKDEMGV